ncbi:MAG: hypothetical protein ACKVKQ_07545 [Flavobacteriales bacterium]|jgi:hypothetical protein|tara:strand:- start:245 stop:442 length:198 start_codon:yes stop_codon:yes gene_type:complete
MKNNIKPIQEVADKITRKAAVKKIGNYGKYAALTALGSYMILSPQKTQAVSAADIIDQGTGFGAG